MKPLARYPAQMPPQGARAIMELAWRTPGAISLALGEPDFPTPPHVLEAAVDAARNGWTKYTSGAGVPELREAVSRKLKRDNGLDCSPDQIVVTAGCVTAVATSLLALCDRGDEVLVPDPAWPDYVLSVNIQGSIPVPYPLRQERGFLPDVAEVEALITPRTKCLILNSPANPTGAVIPRELCRELVDMARRHDLWVISDEIYERIVFEGEHCSPALFDEDGRILTVSGVSKCYAMTGWRIGYVAAPDAGLADIIARLQEPLTSCPVGVSQAAAIAALNGPQDVVETMRRSYQERRDASLEVLRRRGRYRYTPRGAFYLLVDVADSGWEIGAFARAFLAQEGVAVVPGDAFGPGGRGLVRISLASAKEDLLAGLERLCNFCEQLKRGEEPVIQLGPLVAAGDAAQPAAAGRRTVGERP